MQRMRSYVSSWTTYISPRLPPNFPLLQLSTAYRGRRPEQLCWTGVMEEEEDGFFISRETSGPVSLHNWLYKTMTHLWRLLPCTTQNGTYPYCYSWVFSTHKNCIVELIKTSLSLLAYSRWCTLFSPKCSKCRLNIASILRPPVFWQLLSATLCPHQPCHRTEVTLLCIHKHIHHILIRPTRFQPHEWLMKMFMVH